MANIFADNALKDTLQLGVNSQVDTAFDLAEATDKYLSLTSLFDTSFNDFFGNESSSNKKIDIEF